MPDPTFQDRGEQLRRRYGIDGTAGDAQDVEHPYHRDEPTHACLVCGLAERYRKHREDAAPAPMFGHPTASDIANVLAVVDAPYRPGLEVRFEEDTDA